MLINEVFDLCKRLPNDWAELLAAHGLDIRKPNPDALRQELTTKRLKVDRQIVGFADFADDAPHAIEPRRPAMSLLYHALASPNVRTGADGKMLSMFPSWSEIETVENFVFGADPPTLSDLIGEAAGSALSVVVFAYEYRPASQTCHHKHADMVFSRTGISRVGTRALRYMPALRGYVAESDGDPAAFHVLPARYAAFLSVSVNGDAVKFRPMRFRSNRNGDDPSDWVPDDQRTFWIPLHKLFPGDECLRSDTGPLDIGLQFNGEHINEKLFRLHQLLKLNPPNAPPFRVTSGLADIVPSTRGSASVVPTPQKTLVEEASDAGGTLVTFEVPNTMGGAGANPDFDTLSTSLECNSTSAPSYVHVRTEIRDGQRVDLNQDDPSLKDDGALLTKIRLGGYQALNYSDCTAEGWITVTLTSSPDGLPGTAEKPHAAYSLVAAPDFYPRCDQRELTEWTGSSSVPQNLQSQLWNTPPDTLCDVRQSPNLQLIGHPFSREETITALVSLLSSAPKGADIASPAAPRHSHLPDDGAGVFAPGWDVSTDKLPDGTPHLAGYALGSPFPEDAKLCAALSTFWPAVAPDATREMLPLVGNQSGTVSPMTDAEIGLVGRLPWDGVTGPQEVVERGKRFVEFANFNRVDYVRNMLDGLFSMRLTARVDAQEYQNRVLAMAFIYDALHRERTGRPMRGNELKEERTQWIVLSFRAVSQGDAELSVAQRDARLILPGEVYRAVVFANAGAEPAPDFRKKRVPLKNVIALFCDPLNQRVLLREESELQWRRGWIA